jgi:coenzyme F420 hydrogenase subunit beta
MVQGQGRFTVALTGTCLPKCPSLCLNVCPFGGQADSLDVVTRDEFSGENGINQHDLIGWTAGAFAGYSTINGHRARGASGGMVTWMLEKLFEEGEIDRAVCVRPSQDKAHLFEMAVLSDTEQIRASASTRYYPVQFSEIVRIILREGEGRRYAVVGVSCVIQAFRRLMRQNAVAKTRIRYLLGLVCEQYPSAYYTEALVKWIGGKLGNIGTVDYRLKGAVPAWNFQFRAQKKNGEGLFPIGTDESGFFLWHTGYFVPESCSFCDDIFAEAADAVFMDAWLPEYLSDPQGTSIVIVRRDFLRILLLQSSMQGGCKLEPISPEQVVASQSSNVRRKRSDIRLQIAEARRRSQWLPKLRQPEASGSDQERLIHIRRLNRTMRASQRWWPLFRRLPRGLLPLFTLVVDTYAGGLVYGLRRAGRLLRLLQARKITGRKS